MTDKDNEETSKSEKKPEETKKQHRPPPPPPNLEDIDWSSTEKLKQEGGKHKKRK